MAREVFISYRRDDAAGEAGRLADNIRGHFGPESVFMDTSEIRVGEEWPVALRAAVSSAKVLIALIGPQWLLAWDEDGRRRIDDPDDWVRRELQLGLEGGTTIMPLLVRHARMMHRAALPPELARLSSKQAYGIRGESWDHDVRFVLAELEPHVGAPAGGTTSVGADGDPTPAFTADDFRGVALGFDAVDVSSRNATAERIKEIAAFLELDEVVAFSRSRKTAERVGAAIALGVHIRASREVRVDRRALSSLGELLADGRSSRVRYRAVEVLRSSPALIPNYADELTRLAETDPNLSVRETAAKALRPARR